MWPLLFIVQQIFDQPAFFAWQTCAAEGFITAFTTYILHAWLIFYITTVTLFTFLHNLVATDGFLSIYQNKQRSTRKNERKNVYCCVWSLSSLESNELSKQAVVIMFPLISSKQ